MKRFYYVSNNLDDLEAVENDLQSNGITRSQIHVLSERDNEVENHHLHEVEAVLKKDVVHSMELGALIGVCAAAIVLAVAWFAGLTNTAAGWVPFIFLAVVVLGFCTWEGGFLGIQEPNYQFKRFEKELREGRHVLFVDAEDAQESVVKSVASGHPALRPAGTGESAPRWVIHWQNRFKRFIKAMP